MSDSPDKDPGPSRGGRSKLKKADALGLCFRTQDDALNHARDVLKYGADFFTAYGLDIPKRYAMGDVEIVLKFSSGGHYGKYELVFSGVPNEMGEIAISGHYGFAQSDVAREKSNRSNEPVFVGVTQLVEGPDGKISSLVRIERAKVRYDLWGQVFASPFDNVFELRGVISDREVSRFGIGFSAQNGGGKSGKVKGGAQRLDTFDREIGDGVGNGPSHLELVKLIPGLRIRLNRNGVGLSLEKGFTLPTDFVDMLICAGESALRAMERIGHDKEPKRSRQTNQCRGGETRR